MTTFEELGVTIEVDTDPAMKSRARESNRPHYVVRNGEKIHWSSNRSAALSWARAYCAGWEVGWREAGGEE